MGSTRTYEEKFCRVSDWLLHAGLGKYCKQFAALGVTEGMLRSMIMQEYTHYGVQALEDKQKLFRLIKTLNSTPQELERDTMQSKSAYQRSTSMDMFLSSELQRNLSSGIFDVHAIDDMELLPEQPLGRAPPRTNPRGQLDSRHGAGEAASALFPTSSLSPPRSAVQSRSASPVRDAQGSRPTSRCASPLRGGPGPGPGPGPSQPSSAAATPARDVGRSGNLARIKVVVRKRPLNKKETARKEDDVIRIDAPTSLMVQEPKLKVDLTKYVEKHEFTFDAVLDEDISNDEVYRETVEPIVPYIFEKTKATCFAYGQTGSGKTHTMQPLPLRTAQDMVKLLQLPQYRSQNFQLWLSFFEIYGGKVYDLLNERKKLEVREDRRQQVCIVGLKEHRVEDVRVVREHIERGGGARSTGSTGANEESSRSHAILQLVVKKHKAPEPGAGGHRRSYARAEEAEEAAGRVVGKFSFIDLAGSERGADTTDNDKQTRMEGAEINKSLLALKECIRALDHEASHIPFRGSKLTEVLRDSFVGNSRTVMVSCISPGSASVEHTLNTLRYADRVKGLSRSNSTGGVASGLRSSSTLREALATPLPPLPPASMATPAPEREAATDAADLKRSKYDPSRSTRGHSSSVHSGGETLEGKVMPNERGASSSELTAETSETDLESGTEGGSDGESLRGRGQRSAVRRSRCMKAESKGDPGVRAAEGRVTRSRAAAASRMGSEAGQAREVAAAPMFAPIPGWPVAPDGTSEGSTRQGWSSTPAASGAGSALKATATAQLASLLKPPSGRGPVSAPPPSSGPPGSQQPLSLSLPRGWGPPKASTDSMPPFPAAATFNGRAAGRSESPVPASRGAGRRRMGDPEAAAKVVVVGGGSRPEIRGEGPGQAQPERGQGASQGEGEGEGRAWEHLGRRRAPRERPFTGSSTEQNKANGGSTPGSAGLQEEQAVILAHRKHIEETMELVRQEMRLLAELDQPAVQMQRYVKDLRAVLAQKAAGIAALQAQLALLPKTEGA